MVSDASRVGERWLRVLAVLLAGGICACGDAESDAAPDAARSYSFELTVDVDGDPDMAILVEGVALEDVSDDRRTFRYSREFDRFSDAAGESLAIEILVDGVVVGTVAEPLDECSTPARCEIVNRAEREICLFENGDRKFTSSTATREGSGAAATWSRNGRVRG